MKNTTPEFSLIIPFYNEEKNVERVCSELARDFGANGFRYEIIAVNNGSSDGTAEALAGVLRQYPGVFRVEAVPVNQGYGWGVLQGLKIAAGARVGYSVGDGQISAEDVLKAFEKAKADDLDFCQGTRVSRQDSLLRRLNTKTFNSIFRLLFPCGVTDVGSNPKIVKRSMLEKMNLSSRDWFIDCEIISKSYLLGGRMGEVQVASRKRELGESHIRLLSAFQMLKNLVIWRCLAFFWVRGLK